MPIADRLTRAGFSALTVDERGPDQFTDGKDLWTEEYRFARKLFVDAETNVACSHSRNHVGWWECSARLAHSFVLAMLHSRQDIAFRCPMPSELIGDHDMWDVLSFLEQRGAKNRFAAFLWRWLCDLHIKHIAVLINGSP